MISKPNISVYFSQGYGKKVTIVNGSSIGLPNEQTNNIVKTCTFASNFMILEKCGIPQRKVYGELVDAVKTTSETGHGKMVPGALTLPTINGHYHCDFLVFIKLYVHSKQFEGLKTMLTMLGVSLSEFSTFGSIERAILNRMSDKMCHSLWVYLLFSDLVLYSIVCTEPECIFSRVFTVYYCVPLM